MNQKNKSIGIILVAIMILLGTIGSSIFMFYKYQERSLALEKIKQEVEFVKHDNEKLQEQNELLGAKSKNLEIYAEELKEKNNQLIRKIEELENEKEEISEEVDKEVKYAYLTFDDGPSANTIKILDYLKENNIKATFFVNGREGHDSTYKRIVEEGHTIANHSNTHDYAKIYKSVDSFMEDINNLSDLIKEKTGVQAKVFRFPGGSNNTVSHKYGGENIMSKIIPAVEEAGYTYFDWNVDSTDAAKALQDKDVIVNSVLSGTKYTNNAVILMHDAAAKKTTVEALPTIVEGLKKQGFMFKALDPKSHPVKFK